VIREKRVRIRDSDDENSDFGKRTFTPDETDTDVSHIDDVAEIHQKLVMDPVKDDAGGEIPERDAAKGAGLHNSGEGASIVCAAPNTAGNSAVSVFGSLENLEKDEGNKANKRAQQSAGKKPTQKPFRWPWAMPCVACPICWLLGLRPLPRTLLLVPILTAITGRNVVRRCARGLWWLLREFWYRSDTFRRSDIRDVPVAPCFGAVLGLLRLPFLGSRPTN
jgi:hypothetical protein